VRVRAVKTEIDGIAFDSKHEAAVYTELKLRQRAQDITNLQVHPKFRFFVNGVLVGTYTPDFTWHDADDRLHVGDAKGFKRSKKTGKLLPRVDREFGLKRNLMRALFALEIEIL